MYICIIDFLKQNNIVFISDSFSVWCRRISLVTTKGINSHSHYLPCFTLDGISVGGEWEWGTHIIPCPVCGYLPRWIAAPSCLWSLNPPLWHPELSSKVAACHLVCSVHSATHGCSSMVWFPQAADCHSQLTSKPFSGYEYGSAPLPHLFGATGSKTVTEFSSFVTCKTISSLSTPYHLGYKHICGVSCPSTIGSRHKSLSFCFLKAHLVFHPQPQVFLFWGDSPWEDDKGLGPLLETTHPYHPGNPTWVPKGWLSWMVLLAPSCLSTG